MSRNGEKLVNSVKFYWNFFQHISKATSGRTQFLNQCDRDVNENAFIATFFI